MKKVAIYGAGGFGREVKAMALRQGLQVLGFIDDDPEKNTLSQMMEVDDVLVAIANPAVRHKIITDWSRKRVPFESLIHQSVECYDLVTVGRGCIISGGVQMTVDIEIGEFVIIGSNATIGHDAGIGNFSSLMPSVNIGGHVTIGERVFIGAGATVLQGLTIGNQAIIGAGAVVTKDIPAGVTVMGVPARITSVIYKDRSNP